MEFIIFFHYYSNIRTVTSLFFFSNTNVDAHLINIFFHNQTIYLFYFFTRRYLFFIIRRSTDYFTEILLFSNNDAYKSVEAIEIIVIVLISKRNKKRNHYRSIFFHFHVWKILCSYSMFKLNQHRIHILFHFDYFILDKKSQDVN